MRARNSLVNVTHTHIHIIYIYVIDSRRPHAGNADGQFNVLDFAGFTQLFLGSPQCPFGFTTNSAFSCTTQGLEPPPVPPLCPPDGDINESGDLDIDDIFSILQAIIGDLELTVCQEKTVDAVRRARRGWCSPVDR